MRLMRDRGQRIRHGRSDTLSRLLKPLVQELDGPLPGQTSSLGVILRAILLEEPMCGPRIRIEGGRPPRSLELLLHLCDRFSWLEGVLLREVAEVGGLRAAVVQSGVGGIKGHDGGDLLEACLREPVADLPKRLRQSPPRMQDQHPRSAALLGNGQIGADRSAIRLKFSHFALLQTLKNTHETLCFKKHSTDFNSVWYIQMW